MSRFERIPGFPNYIVNDDGFVYSEKTGIVLPWRPNIKYYPRVELKHGAIRQWFFVHRLVAILFVKNPDPRNKIEVNHDDFNIWNPSAVNLTWMTPRENKLYNRKKMDIMIRKNIVDYSDVPF